MTGPAGGARGLAPMDVDVDAAPDAALPIAAALAFAGGASRVTGVERLKEKESDRLAAAVDLLTRAGASARVERDAAGASVLAISGRRRDAARGGVRGARGPPRRDDGGRPRARAARGLDARRPACVGKSWPGFWEAWNPLVTG